MLDRFSCFTVAFQTLELMQLQLDRMEKKFDRIISAKSKKKEPSRSPTPQYPVSPFSGSFAPPPSGPPGIFLAYKINNGSSFAVLTQKTSLFAGFKRSYSDPAEETPLQISGMVYIALSHNN